MTNHENNVPMNVRSQDQLIRCPNDHELIIQYLTSVGGLVMHAFITDGPWDTSTGHAVGFTVIGDCVLPQFNKTFQLDCPDCPEEQCTLNFVPDPENGYRLCAKFTSP